MGRLSPPAFALMLLVLQAGCGSDGRRANSAARFGKQAAEPVAVSCDYRSASEEQLDEPITAFDGCELFLPSPDRALQLRSNIGPRIELYVVSADGTHPRKLATYEPPTGLLWSPDSKTIMINDQKGSGQGSYLEIAHVESVRVVRSDMARRNLTSLFKTLFRCAYADDFVITSGTGWHDASTLVVDVQASHHSGGCPLDPYSSNSLTLLVDARNGNVLAKTLPSP